jgi:SWI/SNF-related matrix-associated actin-dependent regulator of chromatin subfamily D
MIQPQHTPTHGPPPRQAAISQDHRQEALRRISATPTDREIPDGVDERVIGDVAQRYRALREVERKLDAIMMNKRLAAKDSGQRYERRLRVMRVWISSTSPEKEQSDTRMEEAFDFGEDAGGGAYKLKIEGRLLPDPDDEDDDDVVDEAKPSDGENMDVDQPEKSAEAKAPSKPYFERHKLSHYFKQITITFDPSPHALPNAAPPAAPIEWKKPEVNAAGTHPPGDEANFDCLTIERKCDEAVQNITITMHRAEPGRRVRGKLSEPLAKILDREYEDLSSAMMGLHSYVRLNGLEVEGHPQHFRCDEALKAVSLLQI